MFTKLSLIISPTFCFLNVSELTINLNKKDVYIFNSNSRFQCLLLWREVNEDHFTLSYLPLAIIPLSLRLLLQCRWKTDIICPWTLPSSFHTSFTRCADHCSHKVYIQCIYTIYRVFTNSLSWMMSQKTSNMGDILFLWEFEDLSTCVHVAWTDNYPAWVTVGWSLYQVGREVGDTLNWSITKNKIEC